MSANSAVKRSARGAKVSPESAMGRGSGLIPVGRGRSAGDPCWLQKATNTRSRHARYPPLCTVLAVGLPLPIAMQIRVICVPPRA
jgi:hypothetical protein